ncbi:hypothetical protein [uncultured Campylobacter sp.]|uniref:hypothetical protein n=1 Tax=uncultured Campylobacter sp. TaxID=218934 RepID=UPI00260EDA74|nr:hypothetical protein [uncultured Campylobacter sp.]
MNSLFDQPTAQVEILNFQTFTSEYVSKRYGVSEATIRSHKKLHADEIVEGIHFITEQNKFGVNEIKWTLRGIIKLGMFIRSEKAKGFRLWAEQELEKAILKQVRAFAEAREHNLRLVDEISNLRAVQILKGKRHRRELANKQGQITKLKNKLAFFDAPEFKPFSSSHPSYLELFRLYIEALGKCNALNIRIDGLIIENEKLKQSVKSFDKGERITIALTKIQKELDRVYSGIGAVMAYANDNDRFFMEQNEILKG